ncbi:MAG TPA: metallophosphoesterase family protein [Candidatus Marinimicrobia bacterium]|nr:metallophosphoesterase family protein [Candidatus Neomarinimicrobiota bacterium]
MKYLKLTLTLLNFIFPLMMVAQSSSDVAIGPYIQNVTDNSAVVCWATKSHQSFTIENTNQKRSLPQYENHEMILSNLKPNTQYTYHIGGHGLSEEMGQFTTFPDEIEPFQFAILGDTRSRHDVHSKHVDRIIQKNPLFVLNTGDMVGNGLNIHHWETFFDVTKNLMRSIPYFPALGNHEKDSKYYFDFFNLPGNERYYSFSVGDALFISLDLEGIEYQTPEYLKKENREFFWENHEIAYFKKQKEWLEHTLTLHDDAGFIFVYFHKPLISVKKSRVNGAKMRRKFWGNIFERHGVQVVFSGHDHHYHHAMSGGTHYITTAGGGAKLYDIDARQPETVKAIKTEHFIMADVRKKTTILNVIDINGNKIDTITIDKRK